MYVSMKEMLLHAHRNGYAVMAINCTDMEQAKAIVQAAREECSAVIINVSPRQMKAHAFGEIMAPMIRGLAQEVDVPVAFNLDHGSNYEDITHAMRCGFSSVMIDSSSYGFEEMCIRDRSWGQRTAFTVASLIATINPSAMRSIRSTSGVVVKYRSIVCIMISAPPLAVW